MIGVEVVLPALLLLLEPLNAMRVAFVPSLSALSLPAPLSLDAPVPVPAPISVLLEASRVMVSLSIRILSKAYITWKMKTAHTPMARHAAWECRGAIGAAASSGITQVM